MNGKNGISVDKTAENLAKGSEMLHLLSGVKANIADEWARTAEAQKTLAANIAIIRDFVQTSQEAMREVNEAVEEHRAHAEETSRLISEKQGEIAGAYSEAMSRLNESMGGSIGTLFRGGERAAEEVSVTETGAEESAQEPDLSPSASQAENAGRAETAPGPEEGPEMAEPTEEEVAAMVEQWAASHGKRVVDAEAPQPAADLDPAPETEETAVLQAPAASGEDPEDEVAYGDIDEFLLGTAEEETHSPAPQVPVGPAEFGVELNADGEIVTGGAARPAAQRAPEAPSTDDAKAVAWALTDYSPKEMRARFGLDRDLIDKVLEMREGSRRAPGAAR